MFPLQDFGIPFRPPLGLSSTRRRRCCPVATYATRFGPSTATPLGRKRLEDTAKPPSPEVLHPSMAWRWRFFAPPSRVCMIFLAGSRILWWSFLAKQLGWLEPMREWDSQQVANQPAHDFIIQVVTEFFLWHLWKLSKSDLHSLPNYL